MKNGLIGSEETTITCAHTIDPVWLRVGRGTSITKGDTLTLSKGNLHQQTLTQHTGLPSGPAHIKILQNSLESLGKKGP